MPIDFYPQRATEELLVLLDSLQRRQTMGVVSQTSAVGMQTTKSWTGSSRIDVEIRRVLYSLFLRDPTLYTNPYSNRVTRTRPRYVFG